MNPYLRRKTIELIDKYKIEDEFNFMFDVSKIIFDVIDEIEKNPDLNFKGDDFVDENTMK